MCILLKLSIKWGKFVSRDLEEYQCWNVTWLPFGYSSIKELNNIKSYTS